MFSFGYTSDVCKHKKMLPSYRIGQKLSSTILFISSPNIVDFYIIFLQLFVFESGHRK